MNIDTQVLARADSDRNRAAELNAQTRRLDRDRIIISAIEYLEHEARSRGYHFVGCFVGGASGIDTRHTPDNGEVYVSELLAEIRASLSPLVR